MASHPPSATSVPSTITPTSRVLFQRVALIRISEAKALLGAGMYDGAYYLAGYSVECAIKSAICKQFKRHHLPEKEFVNQAYSHSFEKLLQLANLKSQLTAHAGADPMFELSWQLILKWKPEARYRQNTRGWANELVDAVESDEHSFLPWVRTLW